MDKDAVSWAAVIMAAVALIGQVVQQVMQYRAKLVDAQNSVEIAVLKKELEFCRRDHTAAEKRIAEFEAALREAANRK